MEFDGYYQNDILSYANTAVLNVNFGNIGSIISSVYVDNNSNFDQSPSNPGGAPGPANGEVALDIDMILDMAPGAQIVSFEGVYGDDILAAMADPPPGTPFCQQLSSSWTDYDSYTDPGAAAWRPGPSS